MDCTFCQSLLTEIYKVKLRGIGIGIGRGVKGFSNFFFSVLTFRCSFFSFSSLLMKCSMWMAAALFSIASRLVCKVIHV